MTTSRTVSSDGAGSVRKEDALKRLEEAMFCVLVLKNKAEIEDFWKKCAIFAVLKRETS